MDWTARSLTGGVHCIASGTARRLPGRGDPQLGDVEIRQVVARDRPVHRLLEAARADEALRRIPAARPDVAVLDARLPDSSGIEVCRAGPADNLLAAFRGGEE